jgi:hypothetical protein
MSAPWYADTLHDFLHHDDHAIIGSLGAAAHGPVEQTQIEAWRQEIGILKKVLGKRPESPSLNQPGYIIFESPIPRMGSRIDAVLLFPSVIVVIEFKVGERSVSSQARDQVWDYALDLKNFHEPSHTPPIAPVLVRTEAETSVKSERTLRRSSDGVFDPIPTSPAELPRVLELILGGAEGTRLTLDTVEWQHGRYLPTPTIIEAARRPGGSHPEGEMVRRGMGLPEAGGLSGASRICSRVKGIQVSDPPPSI